MQRSKSERVPKYRKQKRNGNALAFVEIDGQRTYLGEYGSANSRERYARFLAEREAGIATLGGPSDSITVTELAAEFWTHAENHYRTSDGSTSRELLNYKTILKHLIGLYGSIPCQRFGPRSLKAVRTRFIQAGWCRTNINRSVSRVRHVFKWGVENELVSASVYHALQAVSGLAKGRTDARENPPRRPVPDSDIESVRKRVSRPVRAMIDLQLHTGARPGELVGLRAVDVDTSGEVWAHRPGNHKTAHHGCDRVVYFGPKAQLVLRGFLADRPVDAYLFDPREAERERNVKAPTHRRPQQLVDSRKTDRKLGKCYTTASYRRAIERGCRAAKIAVWSPHRLRHNAATRLRGEVGLDLAATILGHAIGSRVTEIYAETNQQRAMETIRRIG